MTYSLWTVILAGGIGLGLGLLLSAIIYTGTRDDDCTACPTACAMDHIRAGLVAKGWAPDSVTPHMVVELAPICHSCESRNPEEEAPHA